MVFSGVVNCISLSFVSNARVTIPPHIMHYHILSLDRHSNEQIRKLSKTCAERCNGGCAKFFRQMTFDERPRKPPPPPRNSSTAKCKRNHKTRGSDSTVSKPYIKELSCTISARKGFTIQNLSYEFLNSYCCMTDN